MQTLPIAIGDYVKSEKFVGVAGKVYDIAPCANVMCQTIELTLDPPGQTQFYYHADHFVKVDAHIPAQRTGE